MKDYLIHLFNGPLAFLPHAGFEARLRQFSIHTKCALHQFSFFAYNFFFIHKLIYQIVQHSGWWMSYNWYTRFLLLIFLLCTYFWYLMSMKFILAQSAFAMSLPQGDQQLLIKVHRILHHLGFCISYVIR